MSRQRAHRRMPRAAILLVPAVGVAVLLGGCGGDGISLPSGTRTITGPAGTSTVTLPGGGTSTTEAPTETATTAPTTPPSSETPTAAPTETVTVTPTPTATPTAEPSPEPSPSESPSGEAAGPTDEEESGVSPWVFVLLGFLVLAGLVWWALARAARRRRERAELLDALEARGRWVLDHGVGALIGAADPGAVQEAWSRLDATLTDMAAQVRSLLSTTEAALAPAVTELRDAVAGLKLAAESHARARLGGEASPGTAESLFVARGRLGSALEGLRPPPTD